MGNFKNNLKKELFSRIEIEIKINKIKLTLFTNENRAKILKMNKKDFKKVEKVKKMSKRGQKDVSHFWTTCYKKALLLI